MNRRDFIKTGFLATVSTASAYPLFRIFYRFANTPTPLSEITKPFEQKDKDASARLMIEYNISSFDNAKKLYQEMLQERALYFTGGALAGSVFRSTIDAANPFGKRNLFQRFINTFGCSGIAQVTSYPVVGVAEALQESPLTKPEILVKQYGLPPKDAYIFCHRYTDLIIIGARNGAFTATMLQEIILPLPKKAPSEAVEYSNAPNP